MSPPSSIETPDRRLPLIAALLLALIAGVPACERKGGARVLTLGHGLGPDRAVSKAMDHLAVEVGRLSRGSLKVEVYPGEQLGSERELLELVQLGILSMTKASAAPLEGFVPKMKVLGLPYLFRDDDHMWTVFNGPLGREILDAGRPAGLLGLCFYDAGARSFYTTGKVVKSPKDLAGLKIRVQKSEMAMRMVRCLGGSPTPIDWGELYSALQQGVVDGAENNAPSYTINQHYRICGSLSLDEHLRQPDVLVMNPEVYDGLSAAHQTILRKAVASSVELQRKLWREKCEQSLAVIKKAGVTITRPDKAPFREAVKPLWDDFKGTEVGDLAARIQEVK